MLPALKGQMAKNYCPDRGFKSFELNHDEQLPHRHRLKRLVIKTLPAAAGLIKV